MNVCAVETGSDSGDCPHPLRTTGNASHSAGNEQWYYVECGELTVHAHRHPRRHKSRPGAHQTKHSTEIMSFSVSLLFLLSICFSFCLSFVF